MNLPTDLLHPNKPARWSFRTHALAWSICLCLLLVGATVGTGYWVHSYRNRMAANVWIGSVAVGGLSQDAARVLVQAQSDALFNQGINITLNGSQSTVLTLAGVSSGDVIEDAQLDTNAALAAAWTVGHETQPILAVKDLLYSLTTPTVIPVPVSLNQDVILQSLQQLYPNVQQTPKEARFIFHSSSAGWTASVQDGQPGTIMDTKTFFDRLQTQLADLSTQPVDVPLITSAPVTDHAAAEQAQHLALAALNQAPYTFTYQPDTGSAKSFLITAGLLAQSLAPAPDGSLMLNPAPLTQAIDAFAAPFQMAPQDARFTIENGRVADFVPSHPGLQADDATALAQMQTWLTLAAQAPLTTAQKTLPLPVITAQPSITTAAANELGIVAPLGTGTSTYKGSPPNRLKNIANGVRLLNGMIIPPGATFSAIAALGPFTTDNGYLPELVIKGDQIIPELGGGLCQIGTTTFRAAMNSGLPILERQSHSLVVSYYGDPSNGLPGTDATIYDPEPDLKFKNDTGNNILFEAVMDPKTQTTSFTLWGTPDGRTGSYTPPVVTNRVSPGPEIDTPSPTVTGSAKQCEGPFIGADASFVYTIASTDGSKTTETFQSHYRALAKTCLVSEPTTTAAAPVTTASTSATN